MRFHESFGTGFIFPTGQNEYKKSYATIKTEQKVKFPCGFLQEL